MKLEAILLMAALAFSSASCQKAEDSDLCPGEDRYYNTQTEQCDWVTDKDSVEENDISSDLNEENNIPNECGLAYCFVDEFDNPQHTHNSWTTVDITPEDDPELIDSQGYIMRDGNISLTNKFFYQTTSSTEQKDLYLEARFKIDSDNISFGIGFKPDTEELRIDSIFYFEKGTVRFDNVEDLAEHYKTEEWNTIKFKVYDGLVEFTINGELFMAGEARDLFEYNGFGFGCLNYKYAETCQLDYVVFGLE
jgi:hypothetical protein